MARPMRNRRERGSAPILVVVVVMTISLLVVYLTSAQSAASATYVGMAGRQAKLRYACEAGISYVKNQITYPANAQPPVSPAYTAATNNWLFNKAKVSGSHVQNYWCPVFAPGSNATWGKNPTLVVPGTISTVQKPGAPANTPMTDYDIPVWVWVNDIDTAGDGYRLAAYAQYRPRGSSFFQSTSQENELFLLLELRESQPFSSYMFFTFNDDLRLGNNITVSGSVHANNNLYFPATAPAAIVTGDAKAHLSIINPANGVVGGTSQAGAATVPLPAGFAVTNNRALAQSSTSAPAGTFDVNLGSAAWPGLTGTLSATVTINNGTPPTINVTATGSTGGTLTKTNLPYPDKAVLYVEGNVHVKAPAGFSGKLTVVSGTGDVFADTDLRYRDPTKPVGDPGEYAFRLYDPATSTVLDPATTPGNWAALNYRYEANPNFTGTATLGLMAKNSIIADASGPANLLVNGSFFAETGSPFDATTPAVTKQNLAVGGSLVGTNGVRRTDSIVGFTSSGLYAFDTTASKTPPAGWLSTPAPAYGAVHRGVLTQAPITYLKNTGNTTSEGP